MEHSRCWPRYHASTSTRTSHLNAGDRGGGDASSAAAASSLQGDSTAEAGSNFGAPQKGAVAKKRILRSVAAALVWYAGSSAVSIAVASASGMPIKIRPRRTMPIGPTLLVLYVFSAKKIQKRSRFEGVIPKDEESRQLLADDAYDLAMSWGKPAGRIALGAVDVIVFLAIFRYSGVDFKKLLTGQGLVQLLSMKFWVPYGALSGTLSMTATMVVRRFGHGYLRSTVASLLAPMVRTTIIKPAKSVVSVVGLGADWDLGLTPSERKNRRSSRELRESLSTFKDVNFAEESDTTASTATTTTEPGSDRRQDQEVRDDDGSPPNLRRSP